MEKPLLFPEKIFHQLLDGFHNAGDEFKAEYYIVVDLRDNAPQTVEVFNKEMDTGISLAAFYQAMTNEKEAAPVAILDRESAMWLIGQTAMNNTQYNENVDIGDTDLIKKQPVYQLFPVFHPILYPEKKPTHAKRQ